MLNKKSYYAALDLGSNSFHLIIVKVTDSGIQEVDRVKHMVRLGEGLNKEAVLSDSAIERGLTALAEMGQLLSDIPPEHIRIVGTSTLRVAKNGADFIAAGEKALGHPIEIINGTEEARLIYLGITEHNHFNERNLVIDIGGGSTEIIIGDDSTPKILRSLKVGCANMAHRFFTKGKISKSAVKKAIQHVGVCVEPYIRTYTKAQWERVILSSGTAKAVLRVLQIEQDDDKKNTVRREELEQLLDKLIDIGQSDKLSEQLALDEARAYGFTGGVCILAGLFRHLGIEEAIVSQEALREGVLLELMGRNDGYLDERQRTVTALQTRFDIDTKQAHRVAELARHLSAQLPETAPERFAPLLDYAAELHELGLAVSLSKHQQHGAYLIAHADLPGFSQLMQDIMAILIKGQRKKIPLKAIHHLPKHTRKFTLQYCLCLRLATLIYRGRRHIEEKNYPTIRIKEKDYLIEFPTGYLDSHPLTLADLKCEQEYWRDTEKFELIIL